MITDPEEWLTFQFFLGIGAREQEVMYAEWNDLHFVDGHFSVRAQPKRAVARLTNKYDVDSKSRSRTLPNRTRNLEAEVCWCESTSCRQQSSLWRCHVEP